MKMASKQKELDVFDNWEDIDETDVLERKLKDLLPPNSSIENPSCNGTPVNVILIGDDALRSQYVPPEPTVKILKRPSKDSQLLADSKPLHPKKTLQQREQEYAEARLRILGEAHSPDKSEEKISIQLQNKPTRSVEFDNILRLPRGPDGSRGFNLRR